MKPSNKSKSYVPMFDYIYMNAISEGLILVHPIEPAEPFEMKDGKPVLKGTIVVEDSDGKQHLIRAKMMTKYFIFIGTIS